MYITLIQGCNISYYKVLGLHKEPFSTSPDPSLLYLSKEHHRALYRLRVSVKLKRGLSLILGDVGTGKTTLSRRFVQLASQEKATSVHMLLNPLFSDDLDFLKDLCERFGAPVSPDSTKASYYFNALENYLFRKAVDENQTVILLIDEAQKLNDRCLEVLRGLLNYETNEHKLLQLVLVSQLELVPRIVPIKNFWDRISLKHMLRPLSLEETREMIAYRLKMAGYGSPVRLFTEEAIEAVYRYTHGLPRQITQICHDSLECLVMYNRGFVDKALVEELITRDSALLTLPNTTGISEFGPGREESQRTDSRRAFI